MRRILLPIALSVCLRPVPAYAVAPAPPDSSAAAASPTTEADELARKLANPVAELISVPFQLNYDAGYADGGSRWTLNVQPVIPFALNPQWTLLSRTILPLISQSGGGDRDTGLGDITQSLFFSPTAKAGGWMWGAGPVIHIPIGAGAFTADQWGLGPTAVAVKQVGPWSCGALVNHQWGVSGDADQSVTFLQPFLAKGLGKGVTITGNLESTYDWNADQWTIPLNLQASKVVRLGSQRASVFGGARVFLDAPDGGPDWGLRMGLTLIYPK
ncbi:MAG TPA: transporter [Thermoanaerobaculia bacterium]|nr:transporter [Thermoanaerobaculia bacterium]